MRYAMDASRHAAIFGPQDDLGCEGPGRSRRCKACGDWHRLDRPWPHNCREPVYVRQRLASPQLAPSFEAFRTGALGTAEVIGSRREKREYMKRHDLVEYDEGVRGPDDHWTAEREKEREFVADMKRFIETDPLNLPPDLKAQEHVGDLKDVAGVEPGAADISTDIEVAK